MKTWWEDANDLAGLTIDVEGLAQDGSGAVKAFLPIAVAEDDGVGRAGRIVLAGKQAAEDGGNAEERKSAVGNVQGVDLFRFGAARDADGVTVVDADVLKRAVLLAKDEVIGRSHVEILDVDAWGGEPDADEFVGAGIRKRLEENAFKDAEDDGVAANAGGEGDEGNGREERGAAQTAEDLLQIEHERCHWRSLAGLSVKTGKCVAEPLVIETKGPRECSLKFCGMGRKGELKVGLEVSLSLAEAISQKRPSGRDAGIGDKNANRDGGGYFGAGGGRSAWISEVG